MLFFKQKTLLAVLLFIIVLVFAFISQYQTFVPYEGFEDNVPICQHEDNDVPGCYNVELNDGPVEFSNYSEDYVLKTQIVPPVCPSCPTMFSAHNHGNKKGKKGNKKGKNNKSLNNNSEENNIINSGNETNVSVEETNVSNNEETNVLNNEETNVSNEENNINQEQQYSTVYNVTNNTNSNNSSSNPILGGSLLGGGNNNSKDNSNSQYEKEIARLKNELANLKQSGNSSKNGNCPPCPPCDRCPEPAFTCEKVINYRSQNVGNYLPLPILNDFSTF
tara:strand:- start:594 stop:1424 length:831 start_codon:yes stop_codon:yes gene_type:complete